MLIPAGANLWLVDGPTVSFLGFPYPTRMAVVRLACGDLWLWSPIAWVEPLAKELEALGPVRHLVAPNAIHHLFLGDWVERYPEARLYAAPKLAAKRRDLHFSAELSDEADPAWAGEVDQVVVRGSFFLDEVLFFHRASCSAFVCDLIQRFDPASLSGWRGWLMRLDGLVGPAGSTPREWRASFLRRGVARRGLQTALDWNPERLIIAHGVLPEENGRAALERGLRWLL